MKVAIEARNAFRRRAASPWGLLSLIFLGSALAMASDKPSATPPVAEVQAGTVSRMPDENFPGSFRVFVRLEIRAEDKPLVIPYCGGDKSEGYLPCSARLQRKHRNRWIYAKPILGIVLGTETTETWKAVTIAPGDRAFFNFGFSDGLFGVQEDDVLRIAMDTWDIGTPWGNGVPNHVVWSTPFRFSVK